MSLFHMTSILITVCYDSVRVIGHKVDVLFFSIFTCFFLFTKQIVDETMLEDLNNVLNTGELSNLFASDETDKIVSDMIPVCKAISMPETRENCLAYFVSRVRDKLHIVLCMSPVGDSLRIRCRQFPSLINCTSIDWFHGWPEAALVSVAGASEGLLSFYYSACNSSYHAYVTTAALIYYLIYPNTCTQIRKSACMR